MKLTKAQAATIEAAAKQIQDAYDLIIDAFDVYNAAVRDAYAVLKVAIEVYDEARADATSEIQGVGEELRNTWDERSEKWQSGDVGENASTFIAKFEDFDMSEPFDLDEPDDIEEPENPSDALGELDTDDDWG